MTPEFVEARDSVFTVANNVQRHHINLLRLGVQPAQFQVLQEHRRIVQCEESQPLAAQCQSPIFKPHRLRKRSCLALESLDHGNAFDNLVRVCLQLTILKQIGHQRMQAINGNELLWKIEGRAEMVDTAIDSNPPFSPRSPFQLPFIPR